MNAKNDIRLVHTAEGGIDIYVNGTQLQFVVQATQEFAPDGRFRTVIVLEGDTPWTVTDEAGALKAGDNAEASRRRDVEDAYKDGYFIQRRLRDAAGGDDPEWYDFHRTYCAMEASTATLSPFDWGLYDYRRRK